MSSKDWAEAHWYRSLTFNYQKLAAKRYRWEGKKNKEKAWKLKKIVALA